MNGTNAQHTASLDASHALSRVGKVNGYRIT